MCIDKSTSDTCLTYALYKCTTKSQIISPDNGNISYSGSKLIMMSQPYVHESSITTCTIISIGLES